MRVSGTSHKICSHLQKSRKFLSRLRPRGFAEFQTKHNARTREKALEKSTSPLYHAFDEKKREVSEQMQGRVGGVRPSLLFLGFS